jgi:hypothetical protein
VPPTANAAVCDPFLAEALFHFEVPVVGAAVQEEPSYVFVLFIVPFGPGYCLPF